MPSHVIYARKSTESDDRQVLSIDSQIQELKLLALRRGLPVEEVLTEARSAKAPGRPVFEQLMRRVEREEIGSVLCWKLDRLARNHADTGRVLQALADHKLASVVTFERDYTADGNDRFLGNFELGIATKYIDDLRVNVRRGNRARFQRGWPNFRPPQGYLEDHATKTVVKDPLRFPLVRKMWDLLLSGEMRPSQILAEANETWGYRTRKRPHTGDTPLSLNGLYDLFANPFYMGLIRLKSGESYKGAHEPMVTPDEFTRAQEILGRVNRPRPVTHEFAYAGIFQCGRCGGTLVPEEHVKPSGRRYVYYRCHGRRRPGNCGESSLPEGAFDTWLVGELQRLTIPPRAAGWIREKLERTITSDLEQREAAQESLKRALKQAVQEGETLLNLRLRGQVDGETWDRKRLEILDRQAQLKLQLGQPAARPEDLLKLLDQALAFPAVGIDVLRGRSIVGRRQLVQAIGSNWRVEGRKALYTAKKPFSLIGGATASSPWWAVVKEVRTWLLDESRGFSLPGLESEDTMPREASGV
jgi:DNA invertase Pin-like site-specific DNA recombinase